MSQFFVDLWKEYGLFDIAVYALLCGLALQMLYTKFNTRHPNCGNRLYNVNEENNFIERISHSMTNESLIDPALPDTSCYRYTGYDFETKHRDPLTKSNNLMSAGSK